MSSAYNELVDSGRNVDLQIGMTAMKNREPLKKPPGKVSNLDGGVTDGFAFVASMRYVVLRRNGLLVGITVTCRCSNKGSLSDDTCQPIEKPKHS